MVISSELECVLHVGDRQEEIDYAYDLFCGGGGSGSGILEAYREMKREVRGTFANHDPNAIRIHDANHPDHVHIPEDLFVLNPEKAIPRNRKTTLLWASPSCVQHSSARGNRPINEQQRSHADIIPRWVNHTRPLTILVENVRAFIDWGPLEQMRDAKGELCWSHGNKRVMNLRKDLQRSKKEPESEWELRMISEGYDRFLTPIKSRKGEYFRAWRKEIEDMGYISDYRILKSADYGDPTIRQRLFVQFQRAHTGRHIYWPEPSHAKPDKEGNVPAGMQPWRTAREIIDWSLKGESIFLRKRPLARNTMRRLAIGLVRFGLRDFIMPKDQGHKADHVQSVDYPLPTVQTTSHDHIARPRLVPLEPFTAQLRGTGKATSIDKPVHSLTANGTHELLAEAFLMAIDQTGNAGGNVYPAEDPVHTVVTKANQAVARFSLRTLQECVVAVAPEGVDTGRVLALLEPLLAELKKAGRADVRGWIYTYYSNGSPGADIDEPLPTVRTHEGAAVCYPVLEFDGQFLLLDVLYRMLTTRELQLAQGFAETYKWAGCTKTEIVKAIGNSVSGGLAKALTKAAVGQQGEKIISAAAD